MSDEALRKIETLLAQSPSDSGTRVRWIMEKNKMGEALVDTYYKISNGEKYYSKTSYLHPWTKNGTKFKTRHEAVKALDSDLSAKDNWRQKKTISLKNTSLDKIKLVEISTYVVERELEVDFIEAKLIVARRHMSQDEAVGWPGRELVDPFGEIDRRATPSGGGGNGSSTPVRVAGRSRPTSNSRTCVRVPPPRPRPSFRSHGSAAPSSSRPGRACA